MGCWIFIYYTFFKMQDILHLSIQTHPVMHTYRRLFLYSVFHIIFSIILPVAAYTLSFNGSHYIGGLYSCNLSGDANHRLLKSQPLQASALSSLHTSFFRLSSISFNLSGDATLIRIASSCAAASAVSVSSYNAPALGYCYHPCNG